jgi:tRNA threonylcarbamoyladenosine biosynthesis protein TsaB
MKLLAVETATACLSVSVLDDDHVVASHEREASGKHAKYLVPCIDGLLKRCGLTLAGLDGLAVSIGPGSFTGLRVGLATMMGFRLVTGLPLAAVPTLEAMAWNLRTTEYPLCPVLKARTSEVYWACYQWTKGDLKQLQEERVGSLEMLAQSMHGPLVVYGEGWEANRDALQRLLGTGPQIREAPTEARAASAVSVGQAGRLSLLQGRIAGQGLAPRYVQRAEAELMLERRNEFRPNRSDS